MSKLLRKLCLLIFIDEAAERNQGIAGLMSEIEGKDEGNDGDHQIDLIMSLGLLYRSFAAESLEQTSSLT